MMLASLSAPSLELLALGVFLLLGRTFDHCLLVLYIVYGIRGVLFPYVNSRYILSVGGILVCSILVVRLFTSLFRNSRSFPSQALGNPMLFPCSTHHTRLFPKKHSFSYSYLLVGIPVGWKGNAGGMVSTWDQGIRSSWVSRVFGQNQQDAWYNVDPNDYLLRGSSAKGLRGKLEAFLMSQGEDHHDYPYAYLFTAARFMGYASNPVSIWLLYSSESALIATILEVNNTFGEKHSYFLKAAPSQERPTSSPDRSRPTSAQPGDKPPAFKKSWPKDFYVSVFNSRSGAYSLTLQDPFRQPLSLNGTTTINTTITLVSPSNAPMIIARLFSTSPSINPTTLSWLGKAHFLASWWWVGLATFPRTVVQALTLLFRRGMPWVWRPEPRRNTLPRRADETERVIESVFRQYLQHLVARSSAPLVVRYIAAGVEDCEEQVMRSPAVEKDPMQTKHVEVRVLTPLFYARFVHYSLTLDALLTEFNEAATIVLSRPELLIDLVSGEQSNAGVDPSSTSKSKTSSLFPDLHHVLFTLISYLRSRPRPITNTDDVPTVDLTTTPPTSNHPQSQPQPPSPLPPTINLSLPSMPLPDPPNQAKIHPHTPLELFLLSHLPPSIQHLYGIKVLKLLLSEYVALGTIELLDLQILAMRVLCAWAVGRGLKF